MQGAEFGIGAIEEKGVWYFAFGANMTAKKLTESRSIRPYEAKNGFLPGWRLAFNHKCAPCNCINQGLHLPGLALWGSNPQVRPL